MKELTRNQQTVIRNIASGVYARMDKIESIKRKIETLEEAVRMQETLNENDEKYVMEVTGGYKSTDLFKRASKPTDRTDKDGNVINTTVLEFTQPTEN